MMRIRALSIVVLLTACGGGGEGTDGLSPDGGMLPDGHVTAPDGPTVTGCPTGKAGAACVLALYDTTLADCSAEHVATLTTELAARATLGPLWAEGRALFVTDGPRQIAGSFAAWDPTALETSVVCAGSSAPGPWVAVGPVASGAWQYKLVDHGMYSLDPHNPAFAYDDFQGNTDGENSALVTSDAPVGQLVHLREACSSELGNCRAVIAYLPPHYDALANAATKYPVLFMHDGQNIFDDHDCCFGHTGWEINVAMDREIASGDVTPAIVIGADSTTDRNNEYGLDEAKLGAFLRFQVMELQPAALAQVRWDGQRVAVAGSSLGGLVAMELGLAYPETYRAIASLSGAFWPGMDAGTAVRDKIPGYGKQDVAIYLDHGGHPEDNSDGAADSIEVRDRLLGLGWHRDNSPACVTTGSTVCYYTEPGATHDELAWQARAWRFLRFVLPAD